jgi:hypothetical protein
MEWKLSPDTTTRKKKFASPKSLDEVMDRAKDEDTLSEKVLFDTLIDEVQEDNDADTEHDAEAR